MNIFKNYFRIIWHKKFMIFSYTFIFVILSIFFAKSKTSDVSDFTAAKMNVFVEDNSNSEISKALVDYIGKYEDIDQKVKKENVDDELFYQVIDASVIIPKDFENNRKIEFKSAPQSMTALLVKERINEFLNKVDKYEILGQDTKAALESSIKDLDTKINVSLLKKDSTNYGTANFYFNFLNFLLLSQIILIIGLVMSSYQKKTLSMRNSVSSVPPSRINLILILGHMVFGIIIWLIYIIVFGVLWPNGLSSTNVQLMILNSFVFMTTVVTLGMLISKIFQDEESKAVVVNVVTLGSSFLSGAFVPQKFLGDTTLSIARIFPSYYYITNNNILAESSDINKILPNLLIMLAFNLLFIILINLIKKPITKNREK